LPDRTAKVRKVRDAREHIVAEDAMLFVRRFDSGANMPS
jgi:hypothetical protein